MLAKKLIEANPILEAEVTVRSKEIVRNDGRGVLQILPANDVAGAHGKTYLFVGFDEIHSYKTWDLFEALAPDPTRRDTLTWITSYASIYYSPGKPLYDMFGAGKRGDDPRMYFSWYAGDICTDPKFADLPTAEARANPSMATWGDDEYLAQQKRRLPSHKYRRLHLNLPGMPDGAAYDADAVMDAIEAGRRSNPYSAEFRYVAFVDMSGGSIDDACLAIAHKNENTGRVIVDMVISQTGSAPFNPRTAVRKFSGTLKKYGIKDVTGDKYAGETFCRDFEENGITYRPCSVSKSKIYEEVEPMLNARELELPDGPKLQEQLLGLVWRGTKIDHQSGEHDDFSNAAAGAALLAMDDDAIVAVEIALLQKESLRSHFDDVG